MSAPAIAAADAPVELLEPWVRSRLHPIEGGGGHVARPRSDYDLGPDGRRAAAADLLQPAAVLVGLVERPEGLNVLLTRRADTLSRHSGQIAFPGGRCDPGESPTEAALREAEEEVGLDRSFVRLAGLGDRYETVTGFSITPVVGFVTPGFTLAPSAAEVAEVFETPFAFLMDPANHERRVHEASDGRRRQYYAMPHGQRFIWGATAGMLRALHDTLFAGAEAGAPA